MKICKNASFYKHFKITFILNNMYLLLRYNVTNYSNYDIKNRKFIFIHILVFNVFKLNF